MPAVQFAVVVIVRTQSRPLQPDSLKNAGSPGVRQYFSAHQGIGLSLTRTANRPSHRGGIATQGELVFHQIPNSVAVHHDENQIAFTYANLEHKPDTSDASVRW